MVREFLQNYSHIIIIRSHYIQVKMENNTTLAIFALMAALGLVTALIVVEPNLPQAFAQGQSFDNKLRGCAHGADGRAPQCT
jgi:hypothetical protein